VARVAAEVTKLKAELEASAQATVNGVAGGAAGGMAGGPTADTAAPPPNVSAQVGEAGCGPVSGPAGKPQTLSKKKKIGLERVFVSHLSEPATEGKVTINFFPLGRAEKAVIEVGQGQGTAGELFSVVVQPLTGKVQIQPGEWKHPEDFVEEDDSGEAQVE